MNIGAKHKAYCVFFSIMIILSSMLAEGKALGLVPVLVEDTLQSLGQRLGPDCSKGTKTTWSLNVANKTANNHGWAFKDSNLLAYFLAVDLSTIGFTNNVSASSLVSHECSKMALLLRIILEK